MVDDKEIRCYCDCGPKGSMTSTILKRIMQTLDKHNTAKRGIDEVTGKPYYAVMILDGHTSRMGLPYLKYLNNNYHQWGSYLVCLYPNQS